MTTYTQSLSRSVVLPLGLNTTRIANFVKYLKNITLFIYSYPDI